MKVEGLRLTDPGSDSSQPCRDPRCEPVGPVCAGVSHVRLTPLSPVRLFETPWTVAPQAPLTTGFPRKEYWSGLSFLALGDLPNPEVEPRLLRRKKVLYSQGGPSSGPQMRVHPEPQNVT